MKEFPPLELAHCNAFWIQSLSSSKRTLYLHKCPYDTLLLLSHDFQLDPITHSDLLSKSFTPWLNSSNTISVLITETSHTIPTCPLLQLKPISIDLWDAIKWITWFDFRILCISMVQTLIKPKSKEVKKISQLVLESHSYHTDHSIDSQDNFPQ